MLAGAVAGRAPSLGIASAAINHHTRHPVITAAMGSTLQGDHRGQVRDVLRPRVAPSTGRRSVFRSSPRRCCATSSGSCASCGPTASCSTTTARPGKFPVLHNLHGLEGGGPPLGLVAVGPRTMALAGETVRLRHHAHVLLRAGDDRRRSRPSARGAERAGRDPDAIRIWSCLAAVPDGLSEEDQRPPRCRPAGDLLPGLRRHARLRERLGPGRLGEAQDRPSCSSRHRPPAERSTRPPPPRRCSGSASWSPTSGSTPPPTVAPRTPPAPSPASSSSAATR